MKLFIKKMAVIAAAVTILFGISACDLLNGNNNKDDTPSTTTQTDSTSTSTTTTDTTNTSTSTSTTTTTTTTTGGTSTGGDQTVTTVAAFEELEGLGIDIIFYSNNTWEYCYVSGTQSYAYMSGTYTGNPAQDGEVSLVKTKELPEDTEEDSEPGELVDCEPETMNMIVTNGIIFIQDDEEENDENSTPMYYIRKANEVANYVTLFDDERGNFSLLKIIFYDNYTYRMTEDGKIAQLGTYEGNAGNDGEISLTVMANYSEDDGLIFIENPKTFTTPIVNGCFSEGIPYAREIAVIKGEFSEGLSNFIRFFANGTFLNLGIIDLLGVEMELPGHYGTYTGDPCSTEANTQVVITMTHINSLAFSNGSTDEEESSDLCNWVAYEEEGNSITFTMNNNNQFIYGDSIFIRQ